jgi:hypothetical protein
MWNDTTELYSPLQTYDTPDRFQETWYNAMPLEATHLRNS